MIAAATSLVIKAYLMNPSIELLKPGCITGNCFQLYCDIDYGVVGSYLTIALASFALFS